MIVAYHRPASLDEALNLLGRTNVLSYPLAGGTYLSRHCSEECEVVDLQAVGLDFIKLEGDVLVIGACTRLQSLVDCEDVPENFRKAIVRDFSLNIRNAASLAGTLVKATGRSTLTTSLLALDTSLVWLPGEREVRIGDWLPLRKNWKNGLLIHSVRIPLKPKLVFETVARSPMDQPLVCLALAEWPSGRVRLAAGGSGEQPILVADGVGTEGLDVVVRDACSQWNDAWASAEYRQEVAGILAHRLMQAVQEE
jgi:CO/xanthine dehydrogenase FAD-binding subunit